MELSFFKGFTDTNPESITLDALVALMRTDESVRDYTEKHRYYRDLGDTPSAKYYKNRMPCFGVAARFAGGKRKEHITALTGLSLVDIDHIAPDQMAAVLEKVHADEHTLLAYTTLSGQGLRILFRYQIDENDISHDGVMLSNAKHLAQCHENKFLSEKNCEILRDAQDDKLAVRLSAEQYKQVFEQGNEYYRNLVNLEVDRQCKNVGRLSTIAHDAALHYNPDAVPFAIKEEEKKPVGRPPKVKRLKMNQRSQAEGKSKVERCEALVQHELEQRGVVYGAGTHNKYISDACYMMNRYGVSEEECTAWALERFCDYQTEGNDVAAIVRSCYLQTEEHGTVRLPREGKDSYASVREIQDYLTEKGIKIRHNLITRKMEILVESLELSVESRLRNVPHPDANSQQPISNSSSAAYIDLTDRHVNSLYRAFSLDTGRRLRISDLYIIIESDFYPTYHPLREYLQSLPAWDGTDYINALASRVHVLGCSQEMHNHYFKKWFVAMIATWMVDDVTNHEILTYIGPQGIYKSTFMRQLLPPELRSYFSARNFAHRMNKDDRLELTEMGLIALEELDHMKDYELNQLKAITTDPTVNERAAYAHFRERRAHLASFCGTGNNPRFLTDLTGNRRWLPFMVDSIDSPYEHPLPYGGIYAQAYALWKSHFSYWLNEAENAELEQHNRHFEEPNIEEELILTYLRKPYSNEVGEFLTATRIIELVGAYIKSKLSARHVTMIMKRLGFEQRRTSKARGWNVVILTGDDIKNNQRQDAHQAVSE